MDNKTGQALSLGLTFINFSKSITRFDLADDAKNESNAKPKKSLPALRMQTLMFSSWTIKSWHYLQKYPLKNRN